MRVFSVGKWVIVISCSRKRQRKNATNELVLNQRILAENLSKK